MLKDNSKRLYIKKVMEKNLPKDKKFKRSIKELCKTELSSTPMRIEKVLSVLSLAKVRSSKDGMKDLPV